MEYNSFSVLINWLNAENLNLDKGTLLALLKLNQFIYPVRECLKIIIKDDTIKNKKRFIDIIVQVGNDYALASIFFDILSNPNIRDDNYFVEAILNENNYDKRVNLLQALKNKNIFSNKALFNFIYKLENIELQKRIINCLEFDLGMKYLSSIFSAEKDSVYKILGQIENIIVADETQKFNSVINEYIVNPTRENLISVIEYEKKLKRYQSSRLAVKLNQIKVRSELNNVTDDQKDKNKSTESKISKIKRFLYIDKFDK